MTVIQLLTNYYKKKINFLPSIRGHKLSFSNFSPFFFLSFVIVGSIIFFTISNLVGKKNEEIKNNLTEITESNEFSNLTSYFISKINSPYEEINYIIRKLFIINIPTTHKRMKFFNI